MAEPRILGRPQPDRPGARQWSDETTYKAVGWVGVVLGLAALSDFVLALYPLGLGSPEWEMATIGAIVQGLPLFSVGLFGVWLCGSGLGLRWMLRIVGWLLLIVVVCLLGSLVLLLTDVPLALRATQGVARLGIGKLVIKTVFLGVLFGISYVVAGVVALKQAGGLTKRTAQ